MCSSWCRVTGVVGTPDLTHHVSFVSPHGDEDINPIRASTSRQRSDAVDDPGMCEGRRCRESMPRATSASFNISSNEAPFVIGVSSCATQSTSSAFYMRDAEPSNRNHYDVLGISIKVSLATLSQGSRLCNAL